MIPNSEKNGTEIIIPHWIFKAGSQPCNALLVQTEQVHAVLVQTEQICCSPNYIRVGVQSSLFMGANFFFVISIMKII